MCVCGCVGLVQASVSLLGGGGSPRQQAAQLQRGVIKSFRQPGDARKTIGGKQPKAAQSIAATQESVNAAKGVEQ